MMKRPPQILVRGCAYGDLEGRTMYTIASGKRGPAYLTKWKTLVPLNSSSSSPGGPPPVHGGGGEGGFSMWSLQQVTINRSRRISLILPIYNTNVSSNHIHLSNDEFTKY